MNRTGVTDLIEAESMRNMTEHERDNMASDGKPACVDSYLVSDFLYHPSWNQLDNLMKGRIY